MAGIGSGWFLQVLHPCRGNVDPDAVAMNPHFAAMFTENPVDFGNPFAISTAGDSFSNRANIHVFEVAENSAGFQQLEVGIGDDFDQAGRKVIEWQA